LADSRRALWDDIETNGGQSGSEVVLVEQAMLLVAFFSPRRRDDVGRLASLSSRIATLGYQDFLALKDMQPLLARLANVSLEALQM
jgi:ubiquitin-protein ligase E3 C